LPGLDRRSIFGGFRHDVSMQKEPVMPKWIVLGRLTDRGRANAREIPKFRAQGRERAKAMGVTFDSFLVTGRFDLVWIVDAPNEEAAATFIASIGQVGNASTETMRAFSEPEVDAMMARLPTPG
jgi:uncharacterized protein with GYD domain